MRSHRDLKFIYRFSPVMVRHREQIRERGKVARFTGKSSRFPKTFESFVYISGVSVSHPQVVPGSSHSWLGSDGSQAGFDRFLEISYLPVCLREIIQYPAFKLI